MTRFRRVTDLSLVGALVVVAVPALIVSGVPRFIEWGVAIPLILVAPGYTIVAALFPTSPSVGGSVSNRLESPGWAARVAILLVSSVLVVAIVGVLLSVLGRLYLVPVVLALAACTLVGVVIARYRRHHVAVEQRSDPLFGIRSFPDRSGLSGFQTVALVVGTVALVSAVAITGASPTGGASFSEASLLAGEDTDELLGSDGIVRFVANESNEVHLRIQNHERTDTTYHVVGNIQRVASNGTVLESQRVDAGQKTLSAGKSDVFYRQIFPSRASYQLRLQYLIYKGSMPENPGFENADLTLRHWVQVVEEEQ